MFFSGEIYQYVLNIYYVTGLVLDAEDMQILARLRGRQSMRWLNSITDSMDNLSKTWETVDRRAWQAILHGVSKSQTRLSN